MLIEHAVPIPSRTRGSKYPFAEMKVGDSFLLSGEDSPKKVAGAVQAFRKKNRDHKFTVRVVDDGVRVWRVN